MKYRRVLPILLVMLFLSTSIVKAQQLRLSVDGALAKLIGSDFNDINWGFGVGGHIFFYIDDNILLGIRGAYDRWTPDNSDFEQNVGNIVNADVSGSAWAVEMIPTLRLATHYPMSAVNLFAQAGAGIYILNDKITVNGTSVIDSAPVESIFGSGTRGRFGIQAGGGFSFGSPQSLSIDVFSLYNLVFAETENLNTLQYITINLGISLGI